MEQIGGWLLSYKYWVLFPLAIVEGPIITVMAGLLCNLGILHLPAAYLLIVAGDNVGDLAYYLIGRLGRHKKVFASYRSIRRNGRMIRLSRYMKDNPYKTIFLSKVVLGAGVAGLILAGMRKVPLWLYTRACLLSSALVCAFYLVFGWFFGSFYRQIGQYMDAIAAFTLTAGFAVFVYYLIQYRRKIL